MSKEARTIRRQGSQDARKALRAGLKDEMVREHLTEKYNTGYEAGFEAGFNKALANMMAINPPTAELIT